MNKNGGNHNNFSEHFELSMGVLEFLHYSLKKMSNWVLPELIYNKLISLTLRCIEI